jgi:chromosome segregation ATPase
MNMVIGPNGTGKSTIVCAIALGLGGRPDVLGRARTLDEFIKHGQNSAIIEIELKAKGKCVIRRSFGKTKGSKYKYNGSLLSNS